MGSDCRGADSLVFKLFLVIAACEQCTGNNHGKGVGDAKALNHGSGGLVGFHRCSVKEDADRPHSAAAGSAS